jgi:hypothetical protein
MKNLYTQSFCTFYSFHFHLLTQSDIIVRLENICMFTRTNNDIQIQYRVLVSKISSIFSKQI